MRERGQSANSLPSDPREVVIADAEKEAAEAVQFYLRQLQERADEATARREAEEMARREAEKAKEERRIRKEAEGRAQREAAREKREADAKAQREAAERARWIAKLEEVKQSSLGAVTLSQREVDLQSRAKAEEDAKHQCPQQTAVAMTRDMQERAAIRRKLQERAAHRAALPPIKDAWGTHASPRPELVRRRSPGALTPLPPSTPSFVIPTPPELPPVQNWKWARLDVEDVLRRHELQEAFYAPSPPAQRRDKPGKSTACISPRARLALTYSLPGEADASAVKRGRPAR